MSSQTQKTERLITRPEDLPPALASSLSEREKELIETFRTNGLPFAVTPHFAALAGPEADDPIRRQFIPAPAETRLDPFALDDPLGEARYRITPRLVHQYRDRVLLIAGGTCAGFCRHCFRRVRMSFPAAFIGAEELAPVLDYLAARPEIKEVLVSGGDPLTAGDGEIAGLFGRLRAARDGVKLRLCTRVPITNPARIGAETIALFGRFRPLRMAVHINHPAELAPQAKRVLSAAVEAGIPVLVQTVLLKGINDNAETLASLFGACRGLGLLPYYLFQLDLAPGTAHFRVPLEEGLSIYGELKRAASGPLPAYAVDLPGGGGKILLDRAVIAGAEDTPNGKALLLKDAAGKLWKYPA